MKSYKNKSVMCEHPKEHHNSRNTCTWGNKCSDALDPASIVASSNLAVQKNIMNIRPPSRSIPSRLIVSIHMTKEEAGAESRKET